MATVKVRAALPGDFRNAILVLARCYLWKQLPCELKKLIMEALKETSFMCLICYKRINVERCPECAPYPQSYDPYAFGLASGNRDVFPYFMGPRVTLYPVVPDITVTWRVARVPRKANRKLDNDWKREKQRVQYKPRPRKNKRPINKKNGGRR